VSDPYYGWMWVGYEPWGWAPYHYGRWFSYEGKWCWWPAVGSGGPRPIWAPGLVAFLGFGGHPGSDGLDIGFDSIGWCPLGPRDPFNPWWGRGRGFNRTDFNNINAVPAPRLNDPPGRNYGTNLQGIMTNAHLRSAITTVSAQNFANGAIAHNLQPVNVDMLQQGSLMQGTLPVTPTKASLQPVNRAVNPAALPATAANNQHFISRSVGAASRASLTAVRMNPVASGQRTDGKAPALAGSMAPATRPGAAGTRQNTAIGAQAARPLAGQAGSTAGWSRFGGGNQTSRSPESMTGPGAGGSQQAEPAPQSGQPHQLTPAPQGNQGGWQRFGAQPARTDRSAGVAAIPGENEWNRFDLRPGGGGGSPAPHGGGSTHDGA